MARRRRVVKKKSTSAKEVTGNKTISAGDSMSPSYPYVPTEPEIVKPKMINYGSMKKDSGAGIVKFCKVTAVRDNNNECFVKIKSGVLKQRVISEVKGPFENFAAACKEAEKIIKEKKERGYKK